MAIIARGQVTIVRMADGAPAVMYSLLPSCTSVHMDKTGDKSPSTVSCRMKLATGGLTEIVGVDTPIDYPGRNLLKNGYPYAYAGWTLSDPATDKSTIDTATFGRPVFSIKNAGFYRFYFFEVGKTYTIEYEVYTDTPARVSVCSGDFEVTIPTTKICEWEKFEHTQTAKSTLINVYRTGAPLAANTYVRNIRVSRAEDVGPQGGPWSAAPEDYTILCNGNPYLAGSAVVPVGDTVWSLCDPTTEHAIEVKNVPLTLDGSDGTSGNLINHSKEVWELPSGVTGSRIWGDPSRYIEQGRTYTLVASIYENYNSYTFSVQRDDSIVQTILRGGSSEDRTQTISQTFTATVSGVLQCTVTGNAYGARVNWVKLVQGLTTSLDHEYSLGDMRSELLETKAKTDNFTSTEGGLTLTSIIKLLDSGLETAGMNGIVDTRSVPPGGGTPAFWAGGSFAEALTGLANVIIRHRGEHKIGDLRIGGDGSLAVINAQGDEITKLIRDNVPLLSSLVSGNQDDTGSFDRIPVSNNGNYGWQRIGSFYQDQRATSLVLTVLNDGTKLTIGEGTCLYLSCGTNDPSMSGELARVQVELHNTTLNKSFPVVSFTHGSGIHGSGVASSTRKIDLGGSHYDMPSGSYRIVVKYQLLEQTRLGDTWSEWYMDGGNLTAKLTKTTNQSIFGRGLATIFDANNFFHYGWNKAYNSANPNDPDRYPLLSYRGKIDMPGVLAEYTILRNGAIEDSYGAKIVNKEALQPSLGHYTIYHNIGHSDYRVQVMLVSVFGFVRTTSKTATSATIEIVNHTNSTYIESDFMITFTGRN